MSSENLRQQRALPSVVRAALEKTRMVEDGPALEEELSLFNEKSGTLLKVLKNRIGDAEPGLFCFHSGIRGAPYITVGNSLRNNVLVWLNIFMSEAGG
jgi:hypothetical protein